MNKLALTLSVLALAVGSVAYWRSGGKQDISAARQTIEEEVQQLRAKQQELAESVTAVTRAAYESLQERMRRAGEQLAAIREEATENLKLQADRAAQHAENLKTRVAEGLKSMKDTTVATARKTQEALAKRVRRLQARIDVLEAKLQINHALERAEDNDFEKAEAYLHDSVFHLRDAREALGDDAAYDAQLKATESSLREAVAAVKARAADVRSRIERVVADSDRLIAALETDEQAAEDAESKTTARPNDEL